MWGKQWKSESFVYRHVACVESMRVKLLRELCRRAANLGRGGLGGRTDERDAFGTLPQECGAALSTEESAHQPETAEQEPAPLLGVARQCEQVRRKSGGATEFSSRADRDEGGFGRLVQQENPLI